MAGMSAQQIDAELQRKRNNGIAPTSAANQAKYNGLTAQPISANKAKAATSPISAPVTSAVAPKVNSSPMSATAAAGNTANGAWYPVNNDITAVRNGNSLYDTARGEYAAGRASLENAASAQTASLQNSAKYANQLVQDNRVLEDANFARTNAPAAWDGSVGYRGAQLDRGRQIDDTMRAADLSNALNSVNKDLYSYDANAENAINSRYDELLGAERGYGLNKTASDQSIKESNMNAALQVGEQTGKIIAPQTDWEGLVRQANSDKTALNQSGQAQQYGQKADQRNFEYTAGRDKVQDEQWMKQFNEQVKQNGIGNALNWAQNAISQQNANTSAYSAATSRMNATKSNSSSGGSQQQESAMPKTYTTMKKLITSKIPGGDNTFGPPSPNQQQLIERMILDNLDNLSDDDVVKLYIDFNIPLPK